MGNQCFQCGADIDGEGIEHRGKVFCSDECCEEFEDELTVNGAPDLDELEDEEAYDEEDDFDDDDFDEEEMSGDDYDGDYDDYSDDYGDDDSDDLRLSR
jgi:hypothetical protein